ncbi:hypothetical protein ACOSP7_004997 [Xanthoceras sorbifolium]
MNVLASECSSGCESGWTLYLEHSNFLSPNASHRNPKFVDGNPGFCEEYYYDEENHKKQDDEEEDLSMVSDASSGPPHFHEDEAYCNDVNGHQYPASKATTLPNNGVKKQKRKDRRCREKQELPSFLDDTASSPVINFTSKNNFALNNNQASMESVLDYSQALQGRSAFQDHFGFLQQSSLSGNHLQNNQWL